MAVQIKVIGMRGKETAQTGGGLAPIVTIKKELRNMKISDLIKELKSKHGKVEATEIQRTVHAIINDMRDQGMTIKTTTPSAFLTHDNYETLLFNELDDEWQKKESWVVSNQPYDRAAETTTLSETEIHGEVRKIIEENIGKRRSELVEFLEQAMINKEIRIGVGY